MTTARNARCGGEAAATLYSLIASAKQDALDPFAYLRDSRWKIIAYPMRGEPVPFKTTLHDVTSDPTNRFDLSTSQPAALADMRKRLTPYIQGDAEKYHFKWQWMDASTTGPVKME
jgi:hypothetical protein